MAPEKIPTFKSKSKAKSSFDFGKLQPVKGNYSTF